VNVGRHLLVHLSLIEKREIHFNTKMVNLQTNA
jgi:hypothetical protein